MVVRTESIFQGISMAFFSLIIRVEIRTGDGIPDIL